MTTRNVRGAPAARARELSAIYLKAVNCFFLKYYMSRQFIQSMR